MELTEKEEKAIHKLKLAAKIWPDSLWLFSASGSLHVMRHGENGEQVHLSHGGIDPDYIVCGINISNDGGDW